MENFKPDHSTFGGIIYYSDFNTDYSGKPSKNGSTIASRITGDFLFDIQCQKNLTEREIKKINKIQ